MQALAWLGFALGFGLLLLTGSSVIKTLLIPRNLSSVIGAAAGRSVLHAYRQVTAGINDLHRREKILATGAPVYLFVLLVCWIVCLYVSYALLLLPFTHDSIVLSQGRRNDLARFVNPYRLRDDWPKLRPLLSRPMRRACERKLGLRMPSIT